MKFEKAVNHSVHSEHGEKQEPMHLWAITPSAIPMKSPEQKLFAVPAAFAVGE